MEGNPGNDHESDEADVAIDAPENTGDGGTANLDGETDEAAALDPPDNSAPGYMSMNDSLPRRKK
jgi:hypothetical protein